MKRKAKHSIKVFNKIKNIFRREHQTQNSSSQDVRFKQFQSKSQNNYKNKKLIIKLVKPKSLKEDQVFEQKFNLSPENKIISKKNILKNQEIKDISKTKSSKIQIQKISIDSMLNRDNRETIVEMRNVDIVFGKKRTRIHAVKNLNLNVYKGEVLGIVGESGSGKSTTGNAILGLVDRQNGSIKLKNREVPKKSKKIKGEINKFIVKTAQMIFQDPASSLNPYKNIYKVVSEGLKNLDVRKIFAKTFDVVTANTLWKILKNKEQPPSLSKISVNWVNQNIEKENFDIVIKVLYENIVEELLKIKKHDARVAASYLKERKEVRDNFTNLSFNRRKIEEKLVIDIIESVGLSDDILGRFPLEFSGGQQQRIGISRSVVIKPEIIVADEPISALDVSIQAQVVNIFNDLKEKLNLTIIFIAHDLRMVEYISDRIVVMYKGVMVEVGTAKNIISNPVHPYTKTLIDSIPTIDRIGVSLRSKRYNEKEKTSWSSATDKDAEEEQSWFSVAKNNEQEHYVFGTKKDIITWGGSNYE